MAEAAGFAEATAERLALAVDEAATNVIEHAYKGATDREVELRFEDRGPEFRVELVDTGQMVDPRAVPRVDLERYVTERRTGGLGDAPHGEDHGLRDVPALRAPQRVPRW